MSQAEQKEDPEEIGGPQPKTIFSKRGLLTSFFYAHSHQQVVLRALFGPSLLDAGFLHGGVRQKALADPLVVARFEIFPPSLGHAR